MKIEPIGYVETCFGSKFAVPRQPGLCPSAWGILHFEEEYRFPEAVRGLEQFSHVWLVFGFHKTRGEGWHPTVRPPQLGGNERVGVFASRSTYRPNGMGLSLVKLDEVVLESEKDRSAPFLRVSGIDLVDGTPIYDVKPYLPYVEAVSDAKNGYAPEEIPRFEVRIEPSARAEFEKLDQKDRNVICEVLALDPRPAIHSEKEGRCFGALLCGRNVKFFIQGNCCRISSIESYEKQD